MSDSSNAEIGQVAAYVRVSTQEQLDNDSHERQRERIHEWADRQDGDVDVTIYEDLAISGQSPERDDYQQLMAEYDEYDAVVVRELSRFGRDPHRVLNDVNEILESDTAFISITEAFDTTSATGKAFLRLVAVINGMYADLRREQAKAAVERRREQGEHVGRPPKLSDDELKQVFEWREGGVSYASIANLVQMEDQFDVDEISERTIQRYCKEAGVEPGESAR